MTPSHIWFKCNLFSGFLSFQPSLLVLFSLGHLFLKFIWIRLSFYFLLPLPSTSWPVKTMWEEKFSLSHIVQFFLYNANISLNFLILSLWKTLVYSFIFLYILSIWGVRVILFSKNDLVGVPSYVGHLSITRTNIWGISSQIDKVYFDSQY